MKSLQELESVKNASIGDVKIRLEGAEAPKGVKHVLVCGGTGCTSSKSPLIVEKFNELVKEKGIGDRIKIVRTGCFGLCENGPIVIVYPEGTYYNRVTVEDVEEIVNEDLLADRPVERLYHKPHAANETVERTLPKINFYKKQKRIALRNCGVIDPEKIEEYIALDGYQALAKCLNEYTPDEVIDIMSKSGLRGRGGAGFPTGLKWKFARNAQNEQKYVICNADEGDPGAFMDRSVLEGDPHSVIEAMAIAGYAIGANMGYVYCRAEYPIAVQRLQIAIDQARENGLLGEHIFGSEFSFDMEIRQGAGAFVCGEETALMESIEGRRGEPRPSLRSRPIKAYLASLRSSTMWKRWPISRLSF